MDRQICSTIKTSLGKHFGDEVRVSTGLKHCVVTLPLKTLDESFITLIIEERLDGYFVVHDGGKTDTSLFSQGIKLTEQKAKYQHQIAEHYGAFVADGLIQQGCTINQINDAVLAVAQSVLLAGHEFLHHRPDFTDIPITSQVEKALEAWKPDFIYKIDKDVRVSTHQDSVQRLNFVARGRGNRRSCAVKIIPPTHPSWQARMYGYMGHELDTTPEVKDWMRVAIVTRAEDWKKGPLQIVRRFSHDVVALDTGHEAEIPLLLPETMDRVYRLASRL